MHELFAPCCAFYILFIISVFYILLIIDSVVFNTISIRSIFGVYDIIIHILRDPYSNTIVQPISDKQPHMIRLLCIIIVIIAITTIINVLCLYVCHVVNTGL